MKKRILLVDDHAVVRAGIKSFLDGNYEICGEGANGKEAIEKALELRPDLVILDISMPVMSGMVAARHIRKSLPDIKILILSMHDSQAFLSEAKLAGADAAITKTSPLAELTNTIDQLLGI